MVDDSYPMRINKYLASRNYTTRRGADDLIKKRRVLINGKLAVLGDKVDEGDVVEVNFRPKKYKYFAYNKPRGVITHSAQGDEEEIADVSPLEGVFPVGRLDKDSYGLIILTDDGRITDKLLNPDYVHEKEYRVTTREELPSNFRERMEKGVNIEGYTTKPCKVHVSSPKHFSIILTEGKKHQIRRMCAALNVTVDTLERVRVMNIGLGALKPGAHREIVGPELKIFLHNLGFK